MVPEVEMDRCEVKLEMGKHRITVKAYVKIPSSACTKELAHRLIQHHNLPIHLHEDLSNKLSNGIKRMNEKHFRKQDSKHIKGLLDGSINIADVAEFWGKKYSQVDTFKDHTVYENEEQTSMYHSLVHSPNVTNLLTLEHSYAEEMSALVAKKEEVIDQANKKQDLEMSEAVEKVGTNLTDDDVNHLAARQLEDNEMLEVQWDSQITALKEQQKRNFRTFVVESFAGKEVTTPVTPKDFVQKVKNEELSNDQVDVVLQESFTIHLGAQMKQMHNLRLLSADPLQLCKYQSLHGSDIPPQRIQTSMSLYSHNLNGLVLLVDDRVNTYTGIKKEFARVCGRSTELHFKDLDNQLELVRDLVPSAVQWRVDHPPPQYEYDEKIQQQTPQVAQHLKAGDMYVTRHSNLSDVHVVFHIIVDDSLRFGDINSRHPAILGLRNVLKVACLNDITTLTVPLLLTNTMSEDMTVSWCQKRAELVYKCVKGFMMEMTSWGGAEMKNMQFLVPKGISEDLFQTLAAMLPNIFRVSNPLVIKSN